MDANQEDPEGIYNLFSASTTPLLQSIRPKLPLAYIAKGKDGKFLTSETIFL
jgi:hypothetical protein